MSIEKLEFQTYKSNIRTKMPNSIATLERLKSKNCQEHLWKYLQLHNAARHGSCQKPNRQVYYVERIGMQKLIMHLFLQTVSLAENVTHMPKGVFGRFFEPH